MKRITSSVGLVALGAASLQAAYAPGLSQLETSKPWTVSAAVRGFYDDNYATSINEEESFGFELAPKIGVNLALDQTLLRASYAYSGKYFEDDSHWDHAHEFDASLDHAFSERYSVKLSETFRVAQEPDIFFGATPVRTEGDNVHNKAGIEFEGGLTQVVGYRASYFNDFYDYENTTRAAQLNRVEHDLMLAPTWVVQEDTVLFVGARYHIVDFDDTVTVNLLPVDRSSESYYGFAGLDHEFNSQLSGSARFGFYYLDYDNGDSSTHPYADFSVTYTYAELSSLQLGFKIDQNQTDVTDALSQSSAGGYFVWNHQLAAKLGAKISGAITSSEYDYASNAPGAADEDLYATISAGLTYMICKNFSADAGYIYTDLDSDVTNRSYTRNRVYVGVTASF